MSQFLNNPQAVLPYRVDLNQSSQEIEQSLRTVLKTIVSSWQAIPDDAITITQLTGGITNILYLLENRQPPQASEAAATAEAALLADKVIIRVFGNGTEEIIDRPLENVIFSTLSQMNVGSPTFFGLFENGRIEGFIHFSRTIRPDEMSNALVYPMVAQGLAKFHSFPVDTISHEVALWPQLDRFFSVALELKFEGEKLEKYEAVQPQVMKQAYDTLKAQVQSFSSSSTSAFHRWGAKFALDIVFCHNDLLSGNILLSQHYNPESGLPLDSEITLIDYEYAGYNFRAWDIANHFCEFSGFDFNFKEGFPTDAVRRHFISSYVQAASSRASGAASRLPGLSEALSAGLALEILADDASAAANTNLAEFVAGFDDVLCLFTLASHLFWYSWALVQAKVSKIDFDYFDFATKRYNGYFYHQELFAPKWK